MKKITFKGVFSIMLIGACFSGYAQQKQKMNPSQEIQLTEENQEFLETYGVIRCATVENEKALQQRFPKRANTQQFEESLAPIIAKIKQDRAAGRSQMAVYNIPVVVHVMHNGEAIGTAPNITDAQVISQIDVFNEDFRMSGGLGATNSTGAAVDVEINFCLAKQDATGNPTTGINRVNMGQDGINAASTNAALAAFNLIKPTSQWDPTKYMNMWSVKFSGGAAGLLGYAQFPDPATTGVTGIGVGDVGAVGAANTDGVVAAYSTFGDSSRDDGTFLLNAPYDRGRTMTHEVGHWLGLRHIWGDGGCGVDDFCTDTPESDASNGGCPATHVSCGTTDMVQNYMDYTDDTCMDTFTQDQKDRMQAIMAGSPRRMELNSSIGCQDTAPFIGFTTETLSQNESTDCNFTDITVNVGIGKTPTQPANVTITKAGSATDMVDYEIIGGNLVFPTSGMADQSFTLRVHNDGLVESTETLTLSMTLNANGGDALLTTATNKDMVITIIDNDLARSVNVNLTHFSDDFEDQDISDWTLTDSDGDTNNWGDIFEVTDGGGVAVSPVSLISRSWQVAALTPDNWAVTSAIDLTSAVAPITLEWKVQAAAATWDLEEYSVYVSTSNAIGTLVASTTNFNEIYNDPADSSTSYTRNLDLSAHAGQIVYIGFRHWNCTDQDWLSIDDINVTSSMTTGIQQTVNASNQTPLASSGTIYTSDDTSADVMADITNNNAVDYGCVSTNVSRASGTAVMHHVAGVANYVMGKTYTIAAGTPQAGGNATVKFYFTEAEIAQWEGDTSNARGTIVVIKDDGVSETVVPTIGAFGTHVTLEATFSSGISGTYYFGKVSALGVANNQFNVFNVSPVPSDGELTLSLSTDKNVHVKLLDIRGRSVYAKLHTNNSDMFTAKLDFSAIASGVYMLDVEAGANRAVKKIVIQ